MTKTPTRSLPSACQGSAATLRLEACVPAETEAQIRIVSEGSLVRVRHGRFLQGQRPGGRRFKLQTVGTRSYRTGRRSLVDTVVRVIFCSE